MLKYILARFIQAFISLLVLLSVVFFSVHLTGDPVNAILGPYATEEQAEMLRAHYGLDKPLIIQFGAYLGRLAQGDMGRSISSGRQVSDLIAQRIPASLQLVTAAMVIAMIIALPLGVYSAVRRGKSIDLLARSFALLGQSIPAFFQALLMIMVFALWLNVLPTSGRGDFRHLIMPAIVLGTGMAAGILRLTRSAMLAILDSEYVKLARLKGVSERSVIWKHAFRNALIPVMTYAAVLLATLVAGSIVTETVFAWPGLGRLVVDAVIQRDFPMVQGVVLFIGAVVLLTNLLVDILYTVLDPRVRLS